MTKAIVQIRAVTKSFHQNGRTIFDQIKTNKQNKKNKQELYTVIGTLIFIFS